MERLQERVQFVRVENTFSELTARRVGNSHGTRRKKREDDGEGEETRRTGVEVKRRGSQRGRERREREKGEREGTEREGRMGSDKEESERVQKESKERAERKEGETERKEGENKKKGRRE